MNNNYNDNAFNDSVMSLIKQMQHLVYNNNTNNNNNKSIVHISIHTHTLQYMIIQTSSSNHCFHNNNISFIPDVFLMNIRQIIDKMLINIIKIG